jgi:hypothetical protein
MAAGLAQRKQRRQKTWSQVYRWRAETLRQRPDRFREDRFYAILEAEVGAGSRASASWIRQ